MYDAHDFEMYCNQIVRKVPLELIVYVQSKFICTFPVYETAEISNLFCHTVTHTIRYAGPLCTTVHGISCFMNLVSKDLLVFISAFVGEIYAELNFRANQICME